VARPSKRNRHPETLRNRPAAAVADAAPSAAAGTRLRHALPLALLWGLALLAYSNSFSAALIFDSNRAILQDPRLRAVTAQNSHLIWTQDYWYPSSQGGLFRPLTTLSYQWNYAVLGNGSHAAGYHWTNLLLHLVNLTLVYVLGLAVFEAPWAALALAALWGVHPVLTESVTNVVGRADLLAAFGVLAGLLSYVRGVAARGWRQAAWLTAAGASSAIGIFSKESAIVVLAAVPLYELAFTRGTRWNSRLAGYAALTLPVVIYLQIRHQVLSQLPSLLTAFCDNPLVGADFWTARVTAFKVIGKYLGLLIWPANLSADYSYNQVPLFGWSLASLEDAKAMLGVAMCVAAAAVAVLAWRRAPAVFFFIAFFFAALAPTANLVIVIGSIMAERFLYLPSLGFAGCLVWLGVEACRRRPSLRAAAPVVLVVACLALAGRTFARNADWHDEESLWTSAVKVSPRSYKSHADLALAKMSVMDGSALPAAESEMGKALVILGRLSDRQNMPPVWATAGLLYRIQGDLSAQAAATPQSNPWYRKSLEVFLRSKQIDEAWDRAMRRQNQADGKPPAAYGWPPTYLGLGRLYERLQQPQQALAAFEYGSSLRPQAEFFEEMYSVWRSLGKPENAVMALMEGLAADPTETRLAQRIAQFYQETAPGSCALLSNGGSVALNPRCPPVRRSLCSASKNLAERYRQLGQTAKADDTAANAKRDLGCTAELPR